MGEEASNHHNPLGWVGRTFGFNLNNFRFGKDFSIRRFSITEAALLLMMAYIASRGLGVLRQSIFNALFGTGPEANAYYAAARLPDTLFNLIAGGALSHAFIPIFVSYEKNGQREAWRLTSLVFNVLLVILTAFVLVSEFLAPAFVSHYLVPGYSPSEQALTSTLTRIMLIQPLILGLGTIATAILNSKRQFLLPALSIAVYNFGLIGGLLFSLAIPGIGIYGPTFGILAAAGCQVAVMVPGLLKQGVRYTFIWNLKHPGLYEVMRLLGPNALAVGVVSVGFIVDTYFASYLPDQASLSALHNAQMLYALPLALVAQAISQAALPQLSTLAAAGHYIRLRKTTLKIIGGAVLLSVPSAVLLDLWGRPTIHILFQHGAFTRHSTNLTLKDARTPLFTNLFALAMRYGLIVLLLKLMTGTSVIMAIPLAATVSVTAEALLLYLLLFLRLRAKVKVDKGMQRLQHQRDHAMDIPHEHAEHLNGAQEKPKDAGEADE